MASIVRRSLASARNVKRYRKVTVFMQTERHQSTLATKNPRENQKLKHENSFHSRAFRTSAAANKIVAFHLSDIGEGIREVVIKEWFVKVGDSVQQFDNICEVQSDKAAVTITSRYDGVVSRLYHEVDQTAKVGQPLVDIEVADDGAASAPTSSADATPKPEATKETATNQRVKVLTTPSVRRIASQFQVDLSTVKSTGKNGRIMKEDILSHLNMSSDTSNVVPAASFVAAETIPVAVAKASAVLVKEDRTVPISGFTKAMVKSMTEAMKIPHFGFSDEYDVTKLVAARSELKDLAAARGVKLTYMPLIVKAASLALSEYPVLNASLDANCENLIYKANHNIGVAMDTPNGLVVPVIKNVEQKSILEIAQDLMNLQEKGSKGQLGLNDLTGGTFTISNIGIVGGTYTKPIILPPQVAIGALGKIQVLPRFDASGRVVPAHILTASWSADHRVIDGVTMARFSEQLKSYLVNPYKFLLEL
ncbi:unnamed protein product [Plutella xylostella]|uniref:Dihydrolipoamide acetyltransferase component of pyruvate dehydrogenase complex n=1 Tax=Plutella xylostella TaxID=51655 RepID=A0A8S4FI12_PLUXY|nr:unnamed protein product [Plutella xylostella]